MPENAPQPTGLELKIPPAIVVSIAALLMLGTRALVAPFAIPTAVRIGAAIVFLVAASVFGIGAITKFSRAKTTASPTKPDTASALVTTGIYSLTRNPMYTALVFVLLALASGLANGVALLIIPAFMLYLSRFQIAAEERALAHLFGEEYEAYKKQTRRWI